MRAEQQHRPGRNFFQGFRKTNAALPQIIHYKIVVHDFMQHVNRRPETVENHLDGLKSPANPCAHSMRRGEKNTFFLIHGSIILRFPDFFKRAELRKKMFFCICEIELSIGVE